MPPKQPGEAFPFGDDAPDLDFDFTSKESEEPMEPDTEVAPQSNEKEKTIDEMSAEELGQAVIDKATGAVKKTAQRFGSFVSGLKTSAVRLASRVVGGAVKWAAKGVGGTIKGGIKAGRAAKADYRATVADVKAGGKWVADTAKEDYRKTGADVETAKTWVVDSAVGIKDRAVEAYDGLDNAARKTYRNCREKIVGYKDRFVGWQNTRSLEKAKEKLAKLRAEEGARAEKNRIALEKTLQEAARIKAEYDQQIESQRVLQEQEDEIDEKLGKKPKPYMAEQAA